MKNKVVRQGTYSNSSSQYESSTAYLKQAEEVLLSIQPSVVSNQQRAQRNQLLGLTWFRLGNTSESEMLYDIAQNYYRKAIPMLDPDSNAVYLACAYRDIARTMAIAGGEQDRFAAGYRRRRMEQPPDRADRQLQPYDRGYGPRRTNRQL